VSSADRCARERLHPDELDRLDDAADHTFVSAPSIAVAFDDAS
jgi:hypothetical protein